MSGISGLIVANSYGYTTSTDIGADGISATIVQSSYGYSTGADGIHATTVANSYGYAASTGNTGADGIYASGTVQNSYGRSVAATGIYASSTVSYSYGYSTGTSLGSYGIDAYIAIGCRIYGGEWLSHKYLMP